MLVVFGIPSGRVIINQYNICNIWASGHELGRQPNHLTTLHVITTLRRSSSMSHSVRSEGSCVIVLEYLT